MFPRMPKERWIGIAQVDARANGLRNEDALDGTIKQENWTMAYAEKLRRRRVVKLSSLYKSTLVC